MNLYSDDAERALIGAVLLNPQVIREVALAQDDFYLRLLGEVWSICQKLDADGRPIDIIAIDDELTVKDFQYDGIVFLSKLLDDAHGFNASEYANTIRNYSRRRKLVAYATDIVKAANDMSGDLDHELTRVVDGLVMSSNSKAGAASMRVFVEELVVEVQKRIENPSKIWGIETGFSDFDNVTGGLQQAESLILSGDSGVGKSMFAAQWCAQMAEHGAPGVIYSLEMRGTAIARRLIAGGARVPSWRIKEGRMDDAQQLAFFDWCERIAKLPIFMSDKADVGLLDIRADLARLKQRAGVKWFLLDYMYLLADAHGRDEIEATTVISRGVKTICNSLDLAGISIHSLNKTGMDTNGLKKSMLRGSGQMVYDADVILLMTKDDTDETLRHVKFAKGREIEGNANFDVKMLQGYPYFGQTAKL